MRANRRFGLCGGVGRSPVACYSETRSETMVENAWMLRRRKWVSAETQVHLFILGLSFAGRS